MHHRSARLQRHTRLRILITLFYRCIALAVLETVTQLAFRVKDGQWLYQSDSAFPKLYFERHPYLAIGTVRSVQARFWGGQLSRNNIGARGTTPTLKKRPGVLRVVTFGESSTYCSGVSDDQTWPQRLQEELGPAYEVVNIGVPGYTTVENLIQTQFLADALEPDLCVYYEGFNDLRNTHVKDLEGDYSNFHARRFVKAMGAEALNVVNRVALARGTRLVLRRLFMMHRPEDGRPAPDANAWTRTIDERALGYYRRNLETIALVARARGWRVLFMPQVVMPASMDRQFQAGFMPYVNPDDLSYFQQVYNDAMRDVATRQLVAYADDVLDADLFEPADFGDQAHMTDSGNRKFARRIAPRVRAALAAPLSSP